MGIYLFGHLDESYDSSGLYYENKDLTEEIEVIKKKLKKAEEASPIPSKFQIHQITQLEPFTIVMINYPNCTNHKGMKVLVYKDISPDQVRKFKVIDPHFSDDNQREVEYNIGERAPAPFARFPPTEEGWEMARLLCKTLQGQEMNTVDNAKVFGAISDEETRYYTALFIQAMQLNKKLRVRYSSGDGEVLVSPIAINQGRFTNGKFNVILHGFADGKGFRNYLPSDIMRMELSLEDADIARVIPPVQKVG